MKSTNSVLIILITFFILPFVSATNFDIDQKQKSCASIDPYKMLDADTAYNIAYLWTRKGGLSKWEFETLHDDTKPYKMNCVKYKFDAKLHLPKAFEQYITGLYCNINILKRVCVFENIVTEIAFVEGTSIFSDFHSVEVSRINEDFIETSVKARYQIPWYFSFLESAINEHLGNSLKDHLSVMRDVLCDENR